MALPLIKGRIPAWLKTFVNVPSPLFFNTMSGKGCVPEPGAEYVHQSIVIVIRERTFQVLKIPETSVHCFIDEGAVPVILVENQIG